MTYLVHTLIQESPAHTVGPVINPETAVKAHATAGLDKLAENAGKRAAANVQFDALDRDDADNWRRALEYQYPLDQFDDQRLPAPVVAEIARVRSEGLFDRIEVWSRYHWKSQNQEVVFVGSIGEYAKPTSYYVIAQWSPNDQDAMTTSEALRIRARAHHNPLIAYMIFPDRAKIAFAICGALFALAVFFVDWKFALASLISSGICWIGGEPLSKGDDELAELTCVGMGVLCITSAVLTVVLGAAA